jgi:predicted O-linked N-acetylglucosamine transferase (SPINDLY family)
MSYLLAGMFEDHDRSRFEITAISIGPDDGSEVRKRLKVAFEHFIDATALSDAAVASCIREAETDILVDLQGFTQGARTNILPHVPHPFR